MRRLIPRRGITATDRWLRALVNATSSGTYSVWKAKRIAAIAPSVA